MAIKQRVMTKLNATTAELRAASISAAIEDLKGARDLCHRGLPAKYNALYDEVFAGVLGVLATQEVGDATAEVLSLCIDLLQEVGDNLSRESHFKKEIVFLPYQVSMFDSMESVWQAAVNDSEHAIAYVMPLPYFDRTPEGNVNAWHCDIGKFPRYVPVLDYRRLDLAAMHPDIIIVHNPYDNYNLTTAVDERFCSHHLKEYTDLLVYIPYYVVTGEMQELQGRIPPLFNMDYIVVQAESLIKYFSPDLPRKKFLPLGSPKIDRVVSLCQNPPLPPPAWREKMRGRRVYFYNTSLNTMLGDTERFLEKLRYVFACFRERTDVCLLWRPHPLLVSTMGSMRPECLAEYEELRDGFIAEGFGIYDDTLDMEKSLALSDAYIGDEASSVPVLFGMTGKPVFYLNNRLHHLPQKDDWLGSINRVWDFFTSDWLKPYGNQLWYAPQRDFHYHYVADLSEYGGNSYYGYMMPLDGKLYICPNNAQDIVVAAEGRIVDRIPLEKRWEKPGSFSGAFWVYDEDYFFLAPMLYPAVVRYDYRQRKLDYLPCPNELFVREIEGEKWRGAVFCWREWLIFGSPIDDQAFALNRHTLETKTMNGLCHAKFGGSMFALCREWGDDDYYFFPYVGRKVTRWNLATGAAQEYALPDNFRCEHPLTGQVSDVRPFSSGIFQDEKTILLSPLWGNMFVKFHLDTGIMEEWQTPFPVNPQGKNDYYHAGTTGHFIADLELDSVSDTYKPKGYHFYYTPERRRYHFDPQTEKFTPLEQDTVIDEAELRRHVMGFGQRSEQGAYGCWEDVFNTLPDFLNGRTTGAPFSKERQLAVYGQRVANIDGTAGVKIYEFLRDHGKREVA
ncbi:MAG: hypothetical protein IJ849_06310 [Selenomonadaceae bacterium]|nr:hypothetical protein [Selenomonadaceae bacterium]